MLPQHSRRLAEYAGRCRSWCQRQRCIHTVQDTPFPTFVSHYKSVFSRHAAPLAVITAANGTHARGATVSSLTSLSVSPPGPPLVTFNLRVPSSTSKIMHDVGRFSVNLLSGVYGAEQIARAFAGRALAPAAQQEEPDQVEILDVDWFPRSPEPYNTPMLNHTVIHDPHDNPQLLDVKLNYHAHPVAFARLDCRTQHCFTVRDHEIWVGEVERIDFGNDYRSPDSQQLQQQHQQQHQQHQQQQQHHPQIGPSLVYVSRMFKRVLHDSGHTPPPVTDLRKSQLRHRKSVH
ncbi:flavin reductase like domain-containing protein [Lipomyces kononenkoae]|uniref:Flavin reductase like domain-containing protein n=1 Tax=Lipomyces kononenkoae TaxID=34357 RepID=A0ACC3SYW2_LIPKO